MLSVHDDHVIQKVTDSHIMVIGHHSHKIIHASKNGKKGHLCHTAFIGDDSLVSLNVYNHIWDSGRNETDISEGQIREKEVQGVEVGDTADSQDYEQIPKHCYEVHGQEQSKKDSLYICIF